MAALGAVFAEALLDLTLRNGAYTPTATVYLALYTSDPAPDNSGTEVSGGSYARQAITFGAPASQAVANDSLITFPTATAPWGTITHFAIMDDVAAAGAGDLMYFGPVTTPKVIDSGDVATVAIGAQVDSLV